MMFRGKNGKRDGIGGGDTGESTGAGSASGAPFDENAGPGDEGESFEAASVKLQAEFDELDSRYKRALADFQNYQRRALLNESEARHQGAGSVVRSVLSVIDHFDLALAQDPAKVTVEQLVQGVKVIRDELMRALASHGVGLLTPARNDEFDPMRHEAVMQQEAPGVEPGRVVATLQAGYTLGERVLRPAKVTVSPQAGA